MRKEHRQQMGEFLRDVIAGAGERKQQEERAFFELLEQAYANRKDKEPGGG